MTKRIPTILAIVILMVAVTVSVVATRSVQNLFTKASTGSSPKNIRVTNVTDTSFTVSYLTDTAVKGSAGIQGQIYFPDERDSSLNQAKVYTTHYITIKNLTPLTKYQYGIENGTTTYEVTTAPTLSTSPTSADPIYGSVTKADGTPATGAIIYFSPFGGSPVSTYVKTNGNFLLPVNNIRTTDLRSYLFLKSNDPETIFVEGAANGISTVSCTVGKDKPVPNIILGKDVNCSTAQTTVSPVTVAAVTVTSPTEGEVLVTGLPTFRGKAPVNKVLQVEVRSNPITGTVKTDGSGNWVWPINKALDPGAHTLTVSYLDDKGSTVKIVRNFSVKAATGSTAILPQTYGTPSASIKTPTPTPTRTPTPTKVVVTKPPVTGDGENMLILLTAGMFLVTLGMSTIYKSLWIR